jgi:hypothetical protein
VASLDDVTAARRRRSRALIAAIVLGVSLPLIQYSSEARGYAMALAFGLGAIAIAVRDDVRPMSTAAPAVWALLILAFLSHALALHMLTALGAWAAVPAIRRDGWLRGAGTLAWWLAVPFAAFAAFWAYFLRNITVGGSNREGIGRRSRAPSPSCRGCRSTLRSPCRSCSCSRSRPPARGWSHSGSRDLWILFVVGIIVSPAALANHPADRQLRPPLLPGEHASVAAPHGPAPRMARRTRRRRADRRGSSRSPLSASRTAHAWPISCATVRGAYQEAIRWMVTHTDGDTTLIASDHDFRNRLVVEYYGPRMSKPVRYVSRSDASPTQWYVWQKSPGEAAPITRMAIPRGTYRLVKTVSDGAALGPHLVRLRARVAGRLSVAADGREEARPHRGARIGDRQVPHAPDRHERDVVARSARRGDVALRRANGRSQSSVPWITTCGTPSGTSSSGESSAYRSDRSDGGPAHDLADHALLAFAIPRRSVTGASATTRAMRTGASDGANRSRDALASQSASCPPAECPSAVTCARSRCRLGARRASRSVASATSRNVPG